MKNEIQQIIIRLALLIGLTGFGSARAEAGDIEPDTSAFDKILDRYTTVLERTERVSADHVTDLLKGLDKNGQWSDLNYEDRNRTNWQPMIHVDRLRDLSLALHGNISSPSEQKQIELAILRGVDHWLEDPYQSSNWWHNEIGVPRTLRDVIVLTGDRIDGKRRKALLDVVKQYDLRGTGANLTWSAEIALHYGCLTANPVIVADAARHTQSAIKISDEVGIQSDWSFFQHGLRIQSMAYGLDYLKAVTTVGWQLRDTPWEFSQPKISIVSGLILDGTQWMLRGTDSVPSTMDRKVSRPGALRTPELAQYIDLWAEVDSERSEELEEFRDRLLGQHPPLVGPRHFTRAALSSCREFLRLRPDNWPKSRRSGSCVTIGPRR